jgi:haloalkane dehalogenase
MHDLMTTQPPWLDRDLYPFDSRTFDHQDGRMHYLDEGDGDVLLFVHGTPTWSFLFRHLIDALRGRFRCVAVDHLGFGLSDKPKDAAYHPRDHVARLGALVDHLQLDDVTPVVHDFGGPIGLAWALAHPERVSRVVAFNTWLWSLQNDRSVTRLAGFVRSFVGRWLYTWFNLSPRVLLPSAFSDKDALSDRVHHHYIDPFPDRHSRYGPWKLGCALDDEWYDQLWRQRDVMRDWDMLLIWGMDDPTLGPPFLERWQEAMPHARVHQLDGVGHFAQEESPSEVYERMDAWLNETSTNEDSTWTRTERREALA